MKGQPDKIFRDRLQAWQPPVSANAWSRVCRDIHRTRKKILWLKVAAAVTAVAAMSSLFLPISSFRSSPPSGAVIRAPQPVAPNFPGPDTAPELSLAPRTPAENGLDEKRPDSGAADSATHPVEKLPAPRGAWPTPEVDGDTHADVSNTPVDDGGGIADGGDHELPGAAPIVEKQKVILILSAAEVDEKYLQKNPPPQATNEAQNASTLQKLLEKAYTLKHNQSPMGSLRRKKNEILALNFKDEHPRHENQ